MRHSLTEQERCHKAEHELYRFRLLKPLILNANAARFRA